MKAVRRLVIVAVPLLAAALLAGAALSDPAPSFLRRAAAAALIPALPYWDALHGGLERGAPAARAARRLDARPLSAQARAMWEDLEARFLADEGRLLLISTPPVEIGDACLWQGVYAAAAAIENARAPSPRARRRAERAFEGLQRLGSRGRPLARAVLPLSIVTEPPGRAYHRDERWQWKEDASVDSAAGWVFGCLVSAELLPSRRQEALAALRRFADALLDGGLRLRNSDGRPTRYNSMGGAFVNSPVGLLTSLAALRALDRAGLDPRYGRAHAELSGGDQARWAAYASGPQFWRNETTNHNIGYLALVSALLAEPEPRLWSVYARGLLRLDALTYGMGNSFWVYLSEWAFGRRPELAAGLVGDPDYDRHRARRAKRLAAARVAMLEWRYPECKRKVRWVHPRPPELKRAREPFGPGERAAEPLPVCERPPADFVWQRSPYALDGWLKLKGPGQDFNPVDFLVAYGLGVSVGGLSSAD